MSLLPSQRLLTKDNAPHCWGIAKDDIDATYRCDELLPSNSDRWLRAVDVQASASSIYPWLCQLKVAPYSYDWVDNFGRRSPRHLTPGASDLKIGQRMMTIFEIESFESDKQVTIQFPHRWAKVFGSAALTYQVLESSPDNCRLIAAIRVEKRLGVVGSMLRYALAWGDLVMIRKQLNNFASLAAS